MRATVVGAVLLCLAGCDNTPNPDFERQVQEQKAAKVGDPYQALSSTPQPVRYVRVEESLRQAAAAQEALTLRASYASMLKKLDDDTKMPATTEPVAGCKPAFAEAIAFQSDSTKLDAPALKAAGTVLFERLSACRDRALAAEKAGSAESGALMKRFASTGMVLVGISTISRGDEATGLDLWTRADRLVAGDKPGFELTPNAFRPR